MKTLKDYLYEASLLDIEGTIEAGEEAIKKSIEKWINDNFNANDLKISNNPNSNGKYEVSAKYVSVNNRNITSLTNGAFVWKKTKWFYCFYCDNLTSLEGAPKEVNGDFDCSFCDNLTSLEGAPKKVGGKFNCYNCSSLKSLEGSPKEVGGNFYCSDCSSLKSLKGSPKEVWGSFYCFGCKSLTSLEGAPNKVYGNFNCSHCDSLKSTDLPTTTKIKGEIYK